MEAVVVPLEVHRLVAVQEPGDHLQPLLEALETLGQGQEIPAVVAVLPLLPARAHAQGQPPAGEVVHRAGHAGGHGGVAEGDRRHQGAELDAAGVVRQPGQGDPELQGVLVRRIGVGVVVRAVEAHEAQLLHRPHDAFPAGPVEAHLPFDHDGDLDHGSPPVWSGARGSLGLSQARARRVGLIAARPLHLVLCTSLARPLYPRGGGDQSSGSEKGMEIWQMSRKSIE